MSSDRKASDSTRGEAPPLPTYAGGIVDGEEYGALSGFDVPNLRVSFPTEVSNSHRRKVIIVGAGISGIHQAVFLLNYGVRHEDMHIFDGLEDYGGVWQKNVYPGCACDVPALLYSTTWHLNKRWTHYFATRDEIQKYYRDMAYAYKLPPATSFRSLISSCVWDPIHFNWQVTVYVKRADRTEVEFWRTDILIQAVGQLDRPKMGLTSGRDSFKGAIWHTNAWPKDANLAGKRVAVIGCGSSAAQIIPEIVNEVEHLTVYVRTPPIVVPRDDFAWSRAWRWAFRWIPGFEWFYRWALTLRWATGKRIVARDGGTLNEKVTQNAIKYMESQIQDEELRQLLRPTSKFMCKRPLILSTLYPALSRSNCTVARENLVRYTETGLSSLAENGSDVQRNFDVIILGTGFNVAQYLEHEKIIGRDGINLQEQWEDHPEALYGVGISNMPNQFLCFGPNSSAPWLAQQDIATWQSRYVAELVREIFRRKRGQPKLAIFPDPEVEREYNRQIQKQQVGTYVWARQDCVSYVKNDRGWLTFTMPWSIFQLWRMLRKVDWKEWTRIEGPLIE